MKRRTQGDYMALGALLFIADKALLKALVLIGNMYPRRARNSAAWIGSRGSSGISALS
jgi:hypothetical protein